MPHGESALNSFDEMDLWQLDLLGTGFLPALARTELETMTLAYGPALLVFSLGAIAEKRVFFKDESLKLELVIG